MNFKQHMTKFKLLADVEYIALARFYLTIKKEKLELGRMIYRKYAGSCCSYKGKQYYIVAIKGDSSIVIAEDLNTAPEILVAFNEIDDVWGYL